MESNESPHELLAVRGLRKAFSGTAALSGVDLSLRAGEIHALLGENGAGKSTLIKILAGVHRADDGEVIFRGRKVDPARAKLPIAFIHQDLGLVDGSGPPSVIAPLSMTVAENIALVAGYTMSRGLISWRRLVREAGLILEKLGSGIDPLCQVRELSSAEKSIVAIVRALATKADVLVLDEPTASLPEADVNRLFEVVRNLASQRVAILYVTHRLDEVFELANRITVLRDGFVVARVDDVKGVSHGELVRLIVGRKVQQLEVRARKTRVFDRPLLRVEGLRADGVGPVSFSINRGEIVGLAGLRGAGHEAVGRAVFGIHQAAYRSIRFDDADVKGLSIASAMSSRIGFLSNKRHDECLLSGLTVRENLFPNPSVATTTSNRRLPVGGAIERSRAREMLTSFDVRPLDSERLVETLSGGNQQKVVLARWIAAGSELLMLEEPTLGVDVGARAEIYSMLLSLAESGKALMVFSSDFQEIARICDRAYVFDRGRIVAELSEDTLTNHNLISTASGGSNAGDN